MAVMNPVAWNVKSSRFLANEDQQRLLSGLAALPLASLTEKHKIIDTLHLQGATNDAAVNHF